MCDICCKQGKKNQEGKKKTRMLGGREKAAKQTNTSRKAKIK
jgi:hypothetical protein